MENFKVLLIDDSSVIRRTAQTFLKDKCELHLVDGALDALPMVLRVKPHLIFVDVQMPGLDGFLFCELIKQHEEYKQIPIYFLTSQSSPLDRAKGRKSGADGYLTKPFTRDDLEVVINKFKAIVDEVSPKV